MEGLGQQLIGLDVYRHLASAGAEQTALNAEKVAQINITFEDLVSLFTQVVPLEIDLDTSTAILNVSKSALAHHPDSAQSTCHLNGRAIGTAGLSFFKSGDGLGCRVAAMSTRRIRINPPLAQSLQFEHTLLNLIGVFEHVIAFFGSGSKKHLERPRCPY